MKSDRIGRLMEKNLQAVVEAPDGAVHPVAARRQRMEIKSFVPPSGLVSFETIYTHAQALVVSAAPPPSIDIIAAGDERVKALKEQIRALMEEKSTVDVRIAAAQAQVERRDEEIARLSRLLEVFLNAQHMCPVGGLTNALPARLPCADTRVDVR
jgi:hypothetical protein